MSIPVFFDNKEVVEPGVYARVTSGEPTKPTNFPFGVSVLIDTGTFKGWGGGSGILGTLKSGSEAIYHLPELNDCRNFIKGGEQYRLLDYLFNPKEGGNGPSEAVIIRAAETVPAKIDVAFVNSRLVIKAKNEGSVSNALKNETRAVMGFRLNSQTLVVDNVLHAVINYNSVAVFTYNHVVTTTSLLTNSNLLVEAINASNSGFEAELIGTAIRVTAPIGSGVAGNASTLTLAGGSVTFSDLGTAASRPAFTGGANGTKLLKGLLMTKRAGDRDATKLIFEFWLGNFRGRNKTGLYFGENTEDTAKPILLYRTPELTTADELIFNLQGSSQFKKSFLIDEVLTSITPNGFDGLFTVDDDALEYPFIGGTETYTPEALDAALEYTREMTNTFFLSDRYGEEAVSVQNEKILTAINSESDFERFLIIGGGKDDTKFEDTGEPGETLNITAHYDTEKVIVCHSGAELGNSMNKYTEKYSALVFAYNVAGLLGGQAPQEPITFKSLRLKRFNHILSSKERKRALQGGALHVRDVEGMGIVINQGINTKQKNDILWDQEGKSYEISIMSIASQLNKELILNLRPLFIGHNRGIVTPADVKTNVEAYLFSQTNAEGEARLLVKFKNVTAVRTADQFDITYSFEPNGPINKMFLTGFMLDNINQ